MNKIGYFVLSALSAFSLSACAVSSTDEETDLGESHDALTGPTGSGFFGSDTLYSAMTAAIAAWNPLSNLTYLGTGSGNGEKCMRGQPVVYGGVTYCNGTKDQTIAPMSRPLNNLQAGEANNRIALDAIGLWTKSTQAVSNLSSTDVADAFCGTGLDGSGKRNGSVCNDDLWSEIVSGASNPSNAIKLYRRDDASGTTEVFKEKNNCSAFCSGVKIVVADEYAGPRLSTDPAGTAGTPNTSSLVAYPPATPSASTPCLKADSVTQCIGKLAASDVDVLAYAGLDAETTGAKALEIDSVYPSVNNIRLLISSPSTAYKYARFVFLNDGNGTRASAETSFRAWAFGTGSSTFENALANAGFIRCVDLSDPFYAPLDCN